MSRVWSSPLRRTPYTDDEIQSLVLVLKACLSSWDSGHLSGQGMLRYAWKVASHSGRDNYRDWYAQTRWPALRDLFEISPASWAKNCRTLATPASSGSKIRNLKGERLQGKRLFRHAVPLLAREHLFLVYKTSLAVACTHVHCLCSTHKTIVLSP